MNSENTFEKIFNYKHIVIMEIQKCPFTHRAVTVYSSIIFAVEGWDGISNTCIKSSQIRKYKYQEVFVFTSLEIFN